MTTQTAGRILDYLETGSPKDVSEDARKIYVGASRAQRLLAVAVPARQATRVGSLWRTTGAPVQMVDL